jgi:hypothetical protein
VRFAFLLFLSFAACAAQREPPPQAPAPAAKTARPTERAPRDRTHIDHADLAVDLPGHWEEHPIEGGYDLRKGEEEQVILALFPPAQGSRAADSAALLAEAQQRAMLAQCKRGGVAGASAPAGMSKAVRVHVTCEEPNVVATFIAAPQGESVLSYEHYWYTAHVYSADLDRADDAILASLHVKAEAAACPPDLLVQATSNGGACLEAAVLGDNVVAACARAYEGRGWHRNDAVANALGQQTGKTLVCYQAPR